ncbi:superoxide dismutase [bacterium CG10_46_32]|nr:MAG: superoxide dismutase [bacterium CG10_46_32]PIR56431.1 MAG: superoxide dismutase [Parcubacteria group bacterium CG10_big_fil_rev_8_21_14_0_10_46_32]
MQISANKQGQFELSKLGYEFNALEAAIDAQTMEIHYDKHHKGYVDKLNAALATHPDLAKQPLGEILSNLESVPEDVRTAVRNSGGGHYNHSLFWSIMGTDAGGEPTGSLKDAITETFGSFDAFKEQFTEAALTRFGSGWAWLSLKDGKLEVSSTPNQDSPIMDGANPILGLDVWEHAYYLRYQNKRPEYVTNWWKLVDWKNVSKLFFAK